MEKATVRTHEYSKYWQVITHLQTAEAQHGGEHAKHNVTFFGAVNEFVHVVAVLYHLRRDHVTAVLC